MNNLTAVSGLLSSFQQSIFTLRTELSDLREKYKTVASAQVSTPQAPSITPEMLIGNTKLQEHIEKLVEQKVTEIMDKMLVQMLPPAQVVTPSSEVTEESLVDDDISIQPASSTKRGAKKVVKK